MTLGEMASSPLFWVLTVAINLVSVACAWLIKRAAVGFWQSHTERGRKRKENTALRVHQLAQSPNALAGTALKAATMRWVSLIMMMFAVVLSVFLAALPTFISIGVVKVPLWLAPAIGVLAIFYIFWFGIAFMRAWSLTNILLRAYAELSRMQSPKQEN